MRDIELRRGCSTQQRTQGAWRCACRQSARPSAGTPHSCPPLRLPQAPNQVVKLYQGGASCDCCNMYDCNEFETTPACGVRRAQASVYRFLQMLLRSTFGGNVHLAVDGLMHRTTPCAEIRATAGVENRPLVVFKGCWKLSGLLQAGGLAAASQLEVHWFGNISRRARPDTEM